VDANCDGADDSIHPGVQETAFDEIDSDCDGNDNIDSDGDGVTDELDQCPGQDDTIDNDHDGIPDCNDNLPNQPIEMGDVNNDGNVNIGDSIIALQVVVGKTNNPDVRVEADVNGDGKIGMAEVIYVLQIVSGIRGDSETYNPIGVWNGTIHDTTIMGSGIIVDW